MVSGASGVIDRLRRAVLLSDGGGLSDGQLLERFVAGRDEGAFEVLVRRHGPMVLGVCRRVLGNPHDADDAFQATFLVLIRKAGSLRASHLLANWLYGVAHRTALKARGRTNRRHAAERSMHDVPEPAAPVAEPSLELQVLLDQELGRLPDNYRIPIILCDLEGKTRKEAAQQFGWPEGTLSTRLDRGRHLLAQRLTRRGVAMTAGPLVLALSQCAASAATPAPLISSTLQAAASIAVGPAAAGAISANVVALTEGVLHAMFLTKLKNTILVLALVAVFGTGAGFTLREVLADDPNAGRTELIAAQERVQRVPVQEKAANFTAKVVEVAADGKSIAVEVPSQERGVDPTKKTVQIADKAELIFSGVPLNGAKAAVDQQAQVWLKEGSDAATKIHFSVVDRSRFGRAFHAGKVAAISADGKTITLEMPAGREPAGVRKTDITVTNETKFTYAYVGKDTKPKEGYQAEVWIDDSRESANSGAAAKILFVNAERLRTAHYLTGKIIGVAKDGNSFTLETPPIARGEAPGSKEVKLTVATEVIFNGVGPDGAKVAFGLGAQVWLVEDSQDTAAKVVLTKGGGERGR